MSFCPENFFRVLYWVCNHLSSLRGTGVHWLGLKVLEWNYWGFLIAPNFSVHSTFFWSKSFTQMSSLHELWVPNFSDRVFKELKSNLAFICSHGQNWPTLLMTGGAFILALPGLLLQKKAVTLAFVDTYPCWIWVPNEYRYEDSKMRGSCLQGAWEVGFHETWNEFALCQVTFVSCQSIALWVEAEILSGERDCRREI